MMETSKLRTPDAQVDRLFLERWSPRALTGDPLTQQQIDTLFEATRWAPSAFNRQPWLFMYETIGGKDRELFEQVMVPNNRAWASKASLLVLVLVEKDEDGNLSSGATFDTGSAWMSLALQARIMGLYSHAMAGIDRDAAHKLLNIPQDKYYAGCMIAVGGLGDAKDLPEALREREQPSDRKPTANIVCCGKFS